METRRARPKGRGSRCCSGTRRVKKKSGETLQSKARSGLPASPRKASLRRAHQPLYTNDFIMKESNDQHRHFFSNLDRRSLKIHSGGRFIEPELAEGKPLGKEVTVRANEVKQEQMTPLCFGVQRKHSEA